MDNQGRTIGLTIVITCVVAVLLLATVVYAGVYNVAASSPHGGVVAGILGTVAERSIETHAAGIELQEVGAAAEEEGAEHFHAMCVQCHGAPGVARSEIGEGLNPIAPELSEGAAAEFTEAEIFWIIRNGIRFTGMPSFQASHTDEQIRGLAAFVKSLDGMTPAEYEAIMRRIMDRNGGVLPGSSGGHMHGEPEPSSHTHEPGTPPHID
jgi:mono/diheme cytochrome c family protein